MEEEKRPRGRPPAQSQMAAEAMDSVEDQMTVFGTKIKQMTHDERVSHPITEQEPQTKLSQNQLQKAPDIYLKPIKSIGCRERFNEKFRDEYNFQKEYVNFIAENKEIIGEAIPIWTRPFPGMPAEEWKVPVNKPVWGPRYLAEQIKRKTYRQLKMDGNEANRTGSDQVGEYYGQLAIESHVHRLDANPVQTKRSIFMGAGRN